MKKPILLMSLLASLLFISCSDDNPSNNSDDPTRNCFRKYPYTATAEIMTVIEDSTFCIGIDLNHTFDTVHAQYNVSPTDLDVAVYDTLSSAIVLRVQSYARVKTGTDLTGWWELSDANVSLVSGALTPAELKKIDDDTAFTNSMLTAGDVQIEITADSIYYYYIGSTADLLQTIYTKQLEKTPNSKYIAIKIAKYTDNRITVTGQITGEVVTIASDDKFNQTLSSTNPAHETFTVYVRIEACPIDDPLDWYFEFFGENPSYAQIYIDMIDNAGVLDSVDATATKVNDTIVTITGNKSHEVITATLHTDSTIVYESSNPVHTKYTTTFQQGGFPDWFLVFVIENPKTFIGRRFDY